jgi:hypothetical protein
VTKDAMIDAIARAIARQEGFHDARGNVQLRSLAAVNNNPGNLRSWGDTPTSQGYARFENVAAGWAALRKQVQKNINRGLNLREFFGGKPGVYPGYAPSADGNHPKVYAENVAAWTSLDVDTPLVDQITMIHVAP